STPSMLRSSLRVRSTRASITLVEPGANSEFRYNVRAQGPEPQARVHADRWAQAERVAGQQVRALTNLLSHEFTATLPSPAPCPTSGKTNPNAASHSRLATNAKPSARECTACCFTTTTTRPWT